MSDLNTLGMNTMFMQSNKPVCVAVIGAGAAGLMAAGCARKMGAEVLLFDLPTYVGKKLLITGKGRCNLTNNCTVEEFLENVPKNPRFLYTALNHLSPQDTMELFESLGVPLKTERGRRVFPESDRSSDILAALKRHIDGVTLVPHRVTRILTENNAVSGVTADRDYPCDAVVLATGGCSYPRTGSDGSGYRLAKELGHTLIPCKPSLVPLECEGSLCLDLQGLSLRNIGFHIEKRESGDMLYSDFGELLFTHFGISGPVVLSASAHLRNVDLSSLQAVIDLKPALDEKTLNARLLSDFEKYKNRDFLHALDDLLPQKMIPVIVELSGIDPRKKVHSVTREERSLLLKLLKNFTLPLRAFRPIAEAIVTSGGIDVREIVAKTMMSRLVKNLYFAGEIIDVDAYTGGYNLQIAFSTGALAATSAAISGKDQV